MRKLLLILFLLPITGFSQEETLFYNGNIFTADPAQPYASAVAIKGNKIIAVGNFSEVKKAVNDKAVFVDLHGGCLLPGLIDSHIHAIEGGITLTQPNVFDESMTTTALIDYAKKIMADKEGMTGEFLVIYGLNISTWSRLDELIAAFNAGEFVSQPVWLKGSDGHTSWANKAMLQKAGIDQRYIQSLTDAQRLYFGFNSAMEPNGFAADSGMHKLRVVLPEGKTDYKIAAMKTMEYCVTNGITAFLDPSAAETSDKETPVLDAYAWLNKENKLTAHVAATIVADADGDAQSQIDKVKALQKKFVDEGVSILGFKVFADGVVEYPTQTAAMSAPYTNHPSSSGVLMYNPKKFAHFVTMADKQHLLVHVHAIGDLAVTETLNGFEAARKANGFSGIPHTITHMQFVLPSDFDRFRQLHVLASLQLLWAYGDVTTVDIIKPYISPDIYKWQYPARSLLHDGCIICGASDWPVSSANPFLAMATAETRKGSLGVLDSTQCMPRLAMLYAYTSNAAQALMEEATIGSITPGKYADLVLVDRDVLTVDAESLKNCKVLWTMFEGKVVYKAK